jgi:hypothetical protein
MLGVVSCSLSQLLFPGGKVAFATHSPSRPPA